jgi:hypothetical protein
MTRLAIPPDCTTAAQVVERQRRVLQWRRERKAPVLAEDPSTSAQGPVAPVKPAAPRSVPVALAWSLRALPDDAAQTLRKPPTRPAADIVDDDARAKMRIIRHEVSRQSGFNLRDIDGYARTPYLVLVRHLSYALCARLAESTHTEIGAIHGNRGCKHIGLIIRKMTPVLDKTGLAFNSPVSQWVKKALPLLGGELLAQEVVWQARGRRTSAKLREQAKRERPREGAP